MLDNNKFLRYLNPSSLFPDPIQFCCVWSDQTQTNKQMVLSRQKELVYKDPNDFWKPPKRLKTFSSKTIKNDPKSNENTSLLEDLQE